MFKPLTVVAVGAVGLALLTVIFWAWRTAGLAIMQLGMNLC
ncbi:hypothetical protein [Phytopseudomonas punonensis]|nr:hypothetical protein [Pseudomonas punonensis]